MPSSSAEYADSDEHSMSLLHWRKSMESKATSLSLQVQLPRRLQRLLCPVGKSSLQEIGGGWPAASRAAQGRGRTEAPQCRHLRSPPSTSGNPKTSTARAKPKSGQRPRGTAALAVCRTGRKSNPPDPSLKSLEIDGAEKRSSPSTTPMACSIRMDPRRVPEIAGPDGRFVPANAVIDGTRVIVTQRSNPKPCRRPLWMG